MGGRSLPYNAQGSNVEREAHNTADSFAHGGHKKKDYEGHAAGGKAKHRLDKRARGGRTGAEHSPFSSAARMQDVKRLPSTKDHEQPRKSGGRTGYKHGGGVRPHRIDNRHAGNYGHHRGAGHEEPLEQHMPVHHAHGGHMTEHEPGATKRAHGGRAGMHYRGGGHGHHAKRAEGGRAHHKHEAEDGDEDEDEGRKKYAPYHKMPAFEAGVSSYGQGNYKSSYGQGTPDQQAWDRGMEYAMNRERSRGHARGGQVAKHVDIYETHGGKHTWVDKERKRGGRK
jgi:hypothetical protein